MFKDQVCYDSPDQGYYGHYEKKVNWLKLNVTINLL